MRLITFLVFVFLVGCTKPDESRRLLKSQGLSNIEITGYDFWACSEDDSYKTGFIATGQDGSSVSGTVCAGFFFKGATIRYK